MATTMTMQTTIWKLDTCGCIFETTWDDSLLLNDRIVSHKSIIVNCGKHGNKVDTALFASVKEENARRNNMMGAILELENVTRDKFPSGGSGDKQYGQAVSDATDQVSWSFDPPDVNGVRALHIKVANAAVSKVSLQQKVGELRGGPWKHGAIVLD